MLVETSAFVVLAVGSISSLFVVGIASDEEEY